MLDDGSTVYEKNYVHIMDGRSRIAEVRVGNGTPFPTDISDDVTYHIEDQIGSSAVRLDVYGTIIDKEEFYPFGESSLRTFTYKRYRYAAKELDAESGLYYYGARYYAAWTCRFISVDPLAAKYSHLTPYNYADNNPINDYDIDGQQNNNTPAAPTGGTTATPQASSSSGGCMTCPQTSATSGANKTEANNSQSAYVKPLNPADKTSMATKKFELKKDNVSKNKTIDFTKIQPREPDRLYDANSIDAPGAMDRLPEGAIAGQMARKTMDAYHASGGSNILVEASILFHHVGAPVIQAVGSGYQIYKGGSGGGALPPLSKPNIEQKPIVSPNVQKVLNLIQGVKDQGGTVKLNRLDPNLKQELNMTIQLGNEKLDLRIETHPLSKQLGGDRVTPQRHMNVDLTPGKQNLPNTGHVILNQKF